MSAGQPNYQQVAAQLITRNNDLRARLGMEPREGADLNWQRIADDVRKENAELQNKLDHPVAPRRGRKPKNEAKEESDTPEEKDEGSLPSE